MNTNMNTNNTGRHAQVPAGTRHIVTLCHTSNCCPQIHASADGASVFISDDHGGMVKMSKGEFDILIGQARSGKLDGIIS